MKKLLSVFLILIIILFSGCSSSYMDKTEGDIIPPVQDSTASTLSLIAPLYFRFYNEPMLIRYALNVETTTHEQPEFYALTALLSKPLGERSDITYLFNGKTKLVSVKSDNNYLYVTLSQDFYDDTKGANDEETRLNRKLAIYSIVNTVCEMGNHNYVQIYIEQNGAQLRPDSYTVGFQKSQGDSAPLGPLSRETDLLLTPSLVTKTALNYYSKTEWNKLYLYLTEGATKNNITTNNTNTKVKNINLSGGTYTSDANKNVFLLSTSLKNTHPEFISRGTYSSDPSEYLENGYTTTKDNSLYKVLQNTINVFKENNQNNNISPIIITIIFLSLIPLTIYKLYKRYY